MTENNVLHSFPGEGQKVLCFGHKTFCCKEDMEKEPAWHEVVFKLEVSSYRIKKEFPKDIEEHLIYDVEVYESWACSETDEDGDEMEYHIIGVTKWKNL